ncbi:MAG: CDGSH iron-sulfur domain-containing protein [Solirubrobacteraceae bacterium]
MGERTGHQADGGRAPSGSTAVIVPYEDGPYLVRGPFVVRDQYGQEIELAKRTIALCRCGKSRMRPLCDGTHRAIKWKAPSAAEAWPDRGSPTEPASLALAPAAEPETSESETSESETSESETSEPGPGGFSRARSAASTVARAAVASAHAHACLSRSLTVPCVAREYVAMRFAEPLVGAATTLLAWQDGTEESKTTTDALACSGLRAARALVARALEEVESLDVRERQAWTKQVRSLLGDASSALGSG